MMKKTETNLKQIAYETIKRKIIHCDYMPNDILSEMMLMEEIDASRTPMLMCGKVTHNKLIDSNLTIPNFISNKEQNKHSRLLCFFMFAIDFYSMLSYTVLVLAIQYKTGGGRIGTIY